MGVQHCVCVCVGGVGWCTALCVCGCTSLCVYCVCVGVFLNKTFMVAYREVVIDSFEKSVSNHKMSISPLPSYILISQLVSRLKK